MYEGDNPVALQSIQWLMDALLFLMQEKPYNKINIKDICDKAVLSRQTFYNFFEEKDDILRFYLRKCFNDNMFKSDKRENRDLEQQAKFYSEVFERNSGFFKLIIDQRLEHILSQEISGRLNSVMSKFTSNSNPKIYSYSNAYLTGALTGILIHWMKDSDRITSKEFVILLNEIFSGNYYNSILNSQ